MQEDAGRGGLHGLHGLHGLRVFLRVQGYQQSRRPVDTAKYLDDAVPTCMLHEALTTERRLRGASIGVEGA